MKALLFVKLTNDNLKSIWAKSLQYSPLSYFKGILYLVTI